MGVRLRGVQSFNADLERFADEVDLDLLTVLRRVSLEIFTGITKRTPVDKGFARAGWLVGIGKERSDPRPDLTSKGPGNEGAAAANQIEMAFITGLQDAYTQIIINNHLPYIKYLEQGSSGKAPEGMVAITLAEQSSFLKAFS